MRIFALLAAVTAAASVPHAPLGLGVPLVGLLIAAAVAARADRSLDGALFGVLALALASMPALLDARWVLALDLLAACLLAAVAVAGPRIVALVAPVRALDGLPELVPSAPSGSAPALRGLLMGAVLVLPFAGLFWTADAAFAEVAGSTPAPSLSTVPGRLVVFVLVLLAALGLALAAGRVFPDPVTRAPKLGLPEWAIPLALLDLLFLAFVVVQVTVLFGGHDHVLETAGLTYAEYARQGFWQLIAAAALTLVVVAGAARVAEIRHAADRILLRGLLGTLCLLTLVVVASALHRLRLYEDAFGLTRSRLGAETFTWGLAGLFVVVLLSGVVRPLRRELVRIALAGAALGLLAFSLSNPDGRVAERNVERWRRTGDLDATYLRRLSADAVPVLAELPEPLQTSVLEPLRLRLAEPEPWTSANYGRHRARSVLDADSAPGDGGLRPLGRG
jgi:hypothetical protein